MRQYEATIGNLRWKKAIGGVLVLLAMTATVLPPGRAEIRNEGARVQVRRSKANPTPAAPKPAVPSGPPSYFPDNDISYPSSAGGEPERPVAPASVLYGVSSAALPWNQAGFEDYSGPLQMPRNASLAAPKKYSLQATPVAALPERAPTETAVLIAHLPEHSVFWVEGMRTRSTGRTRYFQSPALLPGRKYKYTVRVAWIEDGQWVSQKREIPIQAGQIQTLYLQANPASGGR